MQIAFWDPVNWRWDPAPYQLWLADHADDLPDGARSFVTHPAHYDYSAFRTLDSDLAPGTGLCTKDLLLREAQLAAAERMKLELRFQFPGFELAEVGAYDLVLEYADVKHFEITHYRDSPLRRPSGLSHFMIDEAVPTRDGVVHEIGFAHGQVRIECTDFEATWR